MLDDKALQCIDGIFGAYRDKKIWVGWRDEGGRKIPINPKTGSNASSNNPETWGYMGSVSTALRMGRYNLTGIGIMLGPLDPERRGVQEYTLAGVDYDNALRPDGSLMPWAQDLFIGDTYCEVSPSGTGVKVLGLIHARPEGIPQGQDGVKLQLNGIEPAVPGKRPGIEVYTDRRWFALTGQPYGTPHPLGVITEKMPNLLRYARSASIPSPPTDDGTTEADAYAAHAQTLGIEQQADLNAKLQAHPDLDRAMRGTDWTDRSQALFAAADLAKGYGLTLAQFVHGIMGSGGAAGAHVNDQPYPHRSLARAWDRSPQPEPITPPPPVPTDIGLGARPSGQGSGLGVPFDMSLLDQVNPLGAPFTPPLDLLSNPPPLPPFVLGGYFPAAPTAMVGTGGTLKSTMWLVMAVHMLLSRPLWGQSWWQGGSALLVSKEDERSIILRRLHDVLHGLNVTERQYREICNRIFIEDWTDKGLRLVESDGKGNLFATDVGDWIIDKYAGRGVAFACIDPMVNFGAGEVHGNDGAAMMMGVGWKLLRGLAGADGRCNMTFIHHLSMAAAREEIEDAHAGRGASALGDNARAVYVIHRHKRDNKNRHVVPTSIPAEAIDNGRVMRVHMAKQSYAQRQQEPLWVVRDGWRFEFVEALPSLLAQQARALLPDKREQENDAKRAALMTDFITRLRECGEAAKAQIIGERQTKVREEAWARLIETGQIERAPGLGTRYRVAQSEQPTTLSPYGF